MKAVRSLSHRRSDDDKEIDAAIRATKRQKCVRNPLLAHTGSSAVCRVRDAISPCGQSVRGGAQP